MIDMNFIRLLQSRGWQVVEVGEDSCRVRCRATGCGLMAVLKSSGHVPQVDPQKNRNVLDIDVRNYDDLLNALRQRRQDLKLSIREIEAACGLADDHLAKIEKPGSVKIPNAQIAIDLCNTLGFDVVLRPSDLPRPTIQKILETRELIESRARRNEQENDRRTG